MDTALHAATLTKGTPGIFHGMKSLFLQNDEGQIDEVYSISAGLDYPGIGPEHADLHQKGRADYVAITDEEAVCAFEYLSRVEGIIPAIESAHAVAAARKIAPQMGRDEIMLINLSGRGDKDVCLLYTSVSNDGKKWSTLKSFPENNTALMRLSDSVVMTWDSEYDTFISNKEGVKKPYTAYVKIAFDVPEDRNFLVYIDEVKIEGVFAETSDSGICLSDGIAPYNVAFQKPYTFTPAEPANNYPDDGVKMTDGYIARCV